MIDKNYQPKIPCCYSIYYISNSSSNRWCGNVQKSFFK